MQIYGNNHIEIAATLVEDYPHNVQIKFETKEEPIYVPKCYIHSQLPKKGETSRVTMDEWYLRKMRIIPLIDRP